MKNIMKNKKLLIGIVVVVLIILVILLFVVFGRKTVCTSSSDQSKNGYTLDTEYVIKSKGDNVKTVKVTETITSKDKKTLDKFYKQLKDQYEYNKKNYGGYTYKVTNSNGKVVSKVTIDYNKMDLKKFTRNNAAMSKYTKNDKFTLEGAKKLYESTGAKCK